LGHPKFTGFSKKSSLYLQKILFFLLEQKKKIKQNQFSLYIIFSYLNMVDDSKESGEWQRKALHF